MARVSALALVIGLGITTLSGRIEAQNALSIPDVTVNSFFGETVPISMTSDCEVQGFVLAVGYDTLLISVTNISIAGTATEAAGAELVVPEVFEAQGGFTLAVVLDAEAPFAGQTIPVGADQDIASFDIIPDLVPVGPPPSSPLEFVDGTFNAPPLDNVIVCGGLSIGAPQGLGLQGGSATVDISGALDTLVIESASGPGNEQTCVRILLDLLSGPAQGFVLAIQHDASIVDLVGIDIDGTVTESVGAEFVVPNLNPAGGDGGTLGVVLDFDPPFGAQTIPIGMGMPIANFCYSCVDPVVVGEGNPVPPPVCAPLTFVDGILGMPPLDNVIVIAGLSLNPLLVNGEVCCEAIEVPVDDTTYRCGVLDPEGDVVDPTGAPGDTVELCFFYTEGSDPNPGNGIPECVGDNIQGFQIGLCFDCNLCFVQGSFTIEGSILEAVGAEFVTHSVDNDPNDGDGCELTVGILLDALPPFDRQTAPPSCEPLLIGCIDVEIKEDAPCNTCLPVQYCDGVNGSENVPIENIVVINNMSVQNFQTFDCNICVVLPPRFIRGDCNGDTKVDLADAASVLAQQFQGFPVPCLDACDANDDGKINLADTVFLLTYQFDSGFPPPDPGPDMDPGPDPTTDDELDCVSGEDPCL